MQRFAIASFSLLVLFLNLLFRGSVPPEQPSPSPTYEHSVQLSAVNEFEFQKERHAIAVTSIQEPATSSRSYSDEDLYWLARIVSAEAKGEPTEGQIAVANVVLNRVVSEQFPDTITEVIFQKGQFSPVGNGTINDEPTKEAIESARRALEGEKILEDDVFFFYNAKICQNEWNFKRKTVKVIGNHTFTR